MATKSKTVKVTKATGLPKPVKDKFRLQGSAAILTYKTHLNKAEYITWFKELVKVQVKQIVLAHETGDSENEYLHTHVVYSLASPIQTTNPRFFDYETDEIIHPHIQPFLNKGTPLHDALKYVCKEDPENAELLKELDLKSPKEVCAGDITKKVWECKTLQDALMLCEKPTDASGIIALFNNKPVIYSIPDRQKMKYSWQKNIKSEFSLPCQTTKEDRRVTWLVDKKGSSGKNEFCRNMVAEFPNDWVYGADMGCIKDAATIVKGWVASGWTGHGLLLNLSRATQSHEQRVYAYIEAIKDGMMCATKYTGGSFMFPVPHIIVCANYEPRYESLSLDRWDVRELVHETEDITDPDRISVRRYSAAYIKKRIASQKSKTDTFEDSEDETTVHTPAPDDCDVKPIAIPSKPSANVLPKGTRKAGSIMFNHW